MAFEKVSVRTSLSVASASNYYPSSLFLNDSPGGQS